jgi:hypothetical protein
MPAVGEARLDLDAAVHRAGMHDDGIWRRQFHPLVADAVVGEIFVDSGNAVEIADAFALDPECHHDVGATDTVLEPVDDPRAEHFFLLRSERARADQTDVGNAHGRQSLHGRTGHPRMRDVADDCDAQVREIRLQLPDREQVEQPLGRMRDVRFTRIQDADVAVYVPRNVGGHAGAGVTHHEHVDLHRLQRVDHVEDAFALLARGCVDIQVQHVCAESLRGQVEGCARAGAGFEEQVGDGAAGERARADDACARAAEECFGTVQQLGESCPVEPAQGEEMSQTAVGRELKLGFIAQAGTGDGAIEEFGDSH